MAKRRADASDRRRVLVGTAKGADRVAALYRDMALDMNAILERRTPEELTAIADFLLDAYALGEDHLGRLS